MKVQGGQEEDSNSVHEESHVSNRLMTWWQNAWWIRVTTYHTCAAPEEGAESGEKPEEPPNRLAMKTGSGRPNAQPKRQRGKNWGKGRKQDMQDGAVRTLY